MVTNVLNSTLAVVNNYHQTVNNNIVHATVENNREQLPVAFIRHKCTKNIIMRNYTNANPNPLSYKQPNADEVMALSAFLQYRTWPLCTKNAQCEKPTLIHRPDVCVVFKELHCFVPNGCNKFWIPLLICKVEGLKASWGNGDQESKAVEEVAYALVFVPKTYIIMFYARRCDFIVCKENPDTGSVDMYKEMIHLQQDGDSFQDKMMYMVELMVKILVKQLTSHKCLIELSLPLLRQNSVDGINIFYPYANVCDEC